MSKTYHVVIVPRAYSEMEEIYDWIASEHPLAAEKWRDSLLTIIDELAQFPRRAPLIPQKHYNRKHLRQLIYGKKRGSYRILFEINGQTVYIRRIVHTARENL